MSRNVKLFAWGTLGAASPKWPIGQGGDFGGGNKYLVALEFFLFGVQIFSKLLSFGLSLRDCLRISLIINIFVILTVELCLD